MHSILWCGIGLVVLVVVLKGNLLFVVAMVPFEGRIIGRLYISRRKGRDEKCNVGPFSMTFIETRLKLYVLLE